MNEQEKTTEEVKNNNQPVLEAISALSQKIDDLTYKVSDLKTEFEGFKRNSENQSEIVRQGIAANYSGFDRLEARFHENRSDMLRLRAYITDFIEEMRQNARETLV